MRDKDVALLSGSSSRASSISSSKNGAHIGFSGPASGEGSLIEQGAFLLRRSRVAADRSRIPTAASCAVDPRCGCGLPETSRCSIARTGSPRRKASMTSEKTSCSRSSASASFGMRLRMKFRSRKPSSAMSRRVADFVRSSRQCSTAQPSIVKTNERPEIL